ncbi:MAG: STAS domain-containing protein [Ignavibacteriaceae bacterium]
MNEDDFSKEVIGDIVIERINIVRATLNEAQVFKERLLADSLAGFNKIIIDLSLCTYVDSTIIGVMVLVSKKIKDKGGKIRVVIPKAETFEVFTIKGLFKGFNLFNSVDEALKNFD